MHPSTKLGQLAEKYGNLDACQGPVENELKGNMWSLFSFAFVYGMREKKQDVVVALVHKEMDGARPLSESILFQYEIPTIGIAAWGLGFWSPLVVLIDLLGTCKQTSPVLRKQLYSGLPGFYEHLVKEFEWSKSDFVSRSRLSWTCLDCPHSHCQLDEGLAKQVKGILQATRHCDVCVVWSRKECWFQYSGCTLWIPLEVRKTCWSKALLYKGFLRGPGRFLVQEFCHTVFFL